MKLTYLGLILTLLLAGAAHASPKFNTRAPAVSVTSVKSYREWKAQRIQSANSEISSLKIQLNAAQVQGRKAQVENLQKELSQQQWNLDVAKELSVTDYFVLYLSQVPETDRFKQAAAKMSLGEIEEMMKAYSEAVGANQAPAPETETLAQSNKFHPVQASQIREH